MKDTNNNTEVVKSSKKFSYEAKAIARNKQQYNINFRSPKNNNNYLGMSVAEYTRLNRDDPIAFRLYSYYYAHRNSTYRDLSDSYIAKELGLNPKVISRTKTILKKMGYFHQDRVMTDERGSKVVKIHLGKKSIEATAKAVQHVVDAKAYLVAVDREGKEYDENQARKKIAIAVRKKAEAEKEEILDEN